MELTKEFVNSCRKVGVLRDFLCQAIDQVDEKDKEIAELEARIAELEEERRWRKFPDEKPEQNGIYIVLLGEHTRTLDVYDTDKGNFRTYKPTAWKPMPKAPEE